MHLAYSKSTRKTAPMVVVDETAFINAQLFLVDWRKTKFWQNCGVLW